MSEEYDFRYDMIALSTDESRDESGQERSDMCDFRHDTIRFSNGGELTEANEGRVNEVIRSMDATLITAREKKRLERREQRKIKLGCDMLNIARPQQLCEESCAVNLQLKEKDNDNSSNNSKVNNDNNDKNDTDDKNDDNKNNSSSNDNHNNNNSNNNNTNNNNNNNNSSNNNDSNSANNNNNNNENENDSDYGTEEVRFATSGMLKRSMQRAVGEFVANKKKKAEYVTEEEANEGVKEEIDDADQEDAEEEEEEVEEGDRASLSEKESVVKTRNKMKRKVKRATGVGNKEKLVAIHLFHKAIRLHDNEGLSEAIKSSPKLLPLYIFNEKLLNPELVGVNQLDFLLQSLVCLHQQLVDKGSRLFVAIGDPIEIMESLIRTLPVNKLTYERDANPLQKVINQKIENLARRQKVRVQSYWAYTLFEPDYLLSLDNCGKALMCMNEFVKVISAAGIPKKPVSAPDTLPPPPSFSPNVLPFLNNSVPSLTTFTGTSGFGYDLKENKIPYTGGEKAALCRLDEVLARGDSLCGDNATSLTPDSTCLSPYISIGALSVRLVYTRVKDTLEHTTCTEPECTNPTCTETAVVLKYQLYRREHAHMFTYLTPDFNHRPNNPLCVCRNIPWLVSGEADSLLKLWEMGRTGYPAVDAVMNQMRTEGWIHHRARELVLSFLTRGGLFIFWKMGMDVLACHLIDHDWCINGFNWHHLSCTAFYLRDFRVHDPVTFFKDYDPDGKYIRKYIPALQDFPAEFIYEPWKASEELQKAANCVIGVNYPKPIVDHEVSSKKNMAVITKVVDKHFILL